MVNDALQQALTGYMILFTKSGIKCPECNTEMLTSKAETTDWSSGRPKPSGHHMPPMCPNCYHGYMAVQKQSNIATPEQMLEAKKRRARNYLQQNSVYAGNQTETYTLKQFLIDNDEQERMKQQALAAVDALVKKETVHAIFLGPTGTGKTHIANGILRAAINASGYELNGFFLDWQEYLSLTKDAMTMPDVAKKVGRIAAELKRADVIVLDDIGSERSTEYAIDAMDRIWRVREDQSMIVTTNLKMQTNDSQNPGLVERYGSRVTGRIKKYGQGHGFSVKNIPDHREMPF